MPDRHDDLEPEVRELLEGMASEAAPPATAPSGVLTTARRRLARNSAAAVVALSLIAGAVVLAVRLVPGDEGRTVLPVGSGSPTAPSPEVSSSPASTGPSPSATGSILSGGIGTGPMPAMVFLDGTVYEYRQSGQGLVASVVGKIPEDTAAQPPVDSQVGVVVLGRAGGDTTLWVLPVDGGAPVALASHVDGFAVSSNGGAVTYATPSGSQASQLIERSLTTGVVLHSASVDTSVQVIGYAGDLVVLDTGDGAASSAAVWSPGAQSISPLDGFGRAIAADPGSGFAVLTQGDGACWSIVLLGPAGQPGKAPPKQGDGCGIAQASFDPDGTTVAAIELRSEARIGSQRFILAGTTSQLGAAVDIDGAFQTQWVDQQHVLVLTEPSSGHLAAVRCKISENTCDSQPVWTGTGAGGEGAAWIVEKRPPSLG